MLAVVNKRDDFSLPTKKTLANRVGQKCSNPSCRKPTCGANDDPQAFTNIGVASHICAAASGGPRYDESMTPGERKSIKNGIWLCQSCSKLIDDDELRYSKSTLLSWKKSAEESAIRELESARAPQSVEHDREIIEFFAHCFDRPAFKDHINQEGRMEDFDKAIEDTIIALSTGVLRTRDGSIIKQFKGKSAIQNPIWHEKLETILNMLDSLRRRLKQAKATNSYTTANATEEDVFYCFNDREVGEWFNSIREEILKEFSSICIEAGLREFHFQRRSYRW